MNAASPPDFALDRRQDHKGEAFPDEPGHCTNPAHPGRRRRMSTTGQPQNLCVPRASRPSGGNPANEMKRNTLTLVLVLLLAPMAHAAPPLPPGVLSIEPRPAPPLKLADMDGNVTDLAGLRGEWVFVHFWASWCGPCRREMPTLQRMHRQLGEQGPRLLLVNTAEDEDAIFEFLSAVAPDLHTLMDSDGQTTELWGPRGLPATFLVDPAGRVRYQVLGGRAWDTAPYLDFLRRLGAGFP